MLASLGSTVLIAAAVASVLLAALAAFSAWRGRTSVSRWLDKPEGSGLQALVQSNVTSIVAKNYEHILQRVEDLQSDVAFEKEQNEKCIADIAELNDQLAILRHFAQGAEWVSAMHDQLHSRQS